MNHRQARHEARIRLTLGIGLALASLSCTLLTLLKWLIQRQPTLAWVRPLTEPAQVLEGAWKWTPTLNTQEWLSGANLMFLVLYWGFFLGLAFIASGRKLGERAASRQHPGPAGAASESPAEPPIRRPSIFTQVHQLYVAPIVTSLIAGLLLKWIFEF